MKFIKITKEIDKEIKFYNLNRVVCLSYCEDIGFEVLYDKPTTDVEVGENGYEFTEEHNIEIVDEEYVKKFILEKKPEFDGDE